MSTETQPFTPTDEDVERAAETLRGEWQRSDIARAVLATIGPIIERERRAAVAAEVRVADGLAQEAHEARQALFDCEAERDRALHVGWSKHNGCGEVIFRQAVHPANEADLAEQGWVKVYAARPERRVL